MTTRETSCEAYRALSASGVLGKRQLLAWQTLNLRGTLTAQELGRAANCKNLWQRLGELRSLGLVSECEPRICRVTGRKAVTYRATLPTGVIERPKKFKAREFWIGISDWDGGAFVVQGNKANDFSLPGYEILKVREVKPK